MKVVELDGESLNFWVAKSEGLALSAEAPATGEAHDPDSGCWHPSNYHPGTDWSHAGPIVSREWAAIEDWMTEQFGPRWPFMKDVVESPLKWFMRAFVASRFGDEVEDQ